MNGRIRNGVVSAILTASMVTGGMPAIAIAGESTASLQSRLADARARFDELALASAEVGESLNDTRYALDQTRANIGVVTEQVDAAQVALDEARDVLGERVAANYRAGSRSLLDMVMGSSTIEELVGAIYYADKVAESDAAAIDAVKTAEAELQEQKSSLEALEQSQVELVSQQEEQAAALEAAEADQAAYIKGLDSQLRSQLEADRAAEIAAQQAAAARALAAQQEKPDAPIEAPLKWQDEDASGETTDSQAAKADTTTTADASANQDQSDTPEAAPADTSQQEEPTTPAANPEPEPEAQPEATPEPVVQPDPEPEPAPAPEPAAEEQVETPAATEDAGETTSSETSSDDYRATILAAAYSQLGVPYVYGAESPGVALDCSGFTQYCYSQAGIDIPHSSVAQAGMADHTSLDELQAGDLVFWEGTAGGSASGSHVAIYLGDGQIIHANGTEVAVGTLSNSWTSCGSIS